MPYTVVQFSRHYTIGDMMHRETWPMQALGTLPEFRVIDVHYQSPYRYQMAFDADLLLLGVLLEPDLMPILRWRKAKGKPTVLDLQNHILEVDPWAPTFEVRNDPTRQAIFLHLSRAVDLAQTTTPFLAKEFAPYCSRTVVFPNQLAREITPADLPQKCAQPLVVAWGGSPSHLFDVAGIASHVAKWIAEHDNTVLWIMGDREIADFFDLPEEKKRHVPWNDMNAYAEFLKGVHIGLAPLRDTPFNRSRSDVKWLEYAAYGCIFVGQRMEVYSAVEDGKTGFLFDGTDQLLQVLDRLYQDRGLMESVRQAAFDHVTKNRRYEDHIRERAQVYKELIERKPPAGGEAWNLHQQVRLPRMKLPEPMPDYLPVKPQPDEERALDSLYFHRTDISEDVIRWLEQRYGESHFTCYTRAQLAMARRDAGAADGYLRRALSYYPASVETMDFHGRILLGGGQLEEAHRSLSMAVQWHSAFIPAYVHLIVVLEQQSKWDEAMAVADEWEKHCNQDPRAHMIKGRILIRSGRAKEGIETIEEAMRRFKEEFTYWQRPLTADLVNMLQELDGAMAKEEAWSDLILKAAEMFPYGLWLAVRAGAICFQRAEYDRGAHILQAARLRLLGWEWQSREESGAPHQYRGAIEMYRAACEERLR